MNSIVSADEMRRLEESCFASGAASSVELMQIAGRGCADLALQFLRTLPACRRIVFFAGSGNNGGDGVVIADTLARKQDLPVVLALAKPGKLSESSAHFFARLDKRVEVVAAGDVVLSQSDLVVDALLGIGCSSPMREPYAGLIKAINDSQAAVLAVDLPSGLGTDCCVKAHLTAVIGFFKDVLFTAQGIENAGLLRLVELPQLYDFAPAGRVGEAASGAWYRANLVPFPRSVHKYQRGSVVIAGGSQEYFQAPFLSARAALRGGAGIVRLALPFAPAPGSGTLSVIPTSLPAESGALGGQAFEILTAYLDKAAVLAIGPGMGRSRATECFVQKAIQTDKILIIDADAIVLTAGLTDLLRQRQAQTILTPHRGEARALAAGLDITLTGNDIEDAVNLARSARSVILLKGARTVCAEPGGRYVVNTSGTPALATAGSGDVLTGLLAARAAANPEGDMLAAAAQAAFLHGMAGELGSMIYGESGVIADDLPELAAQAAMRLSRRSDIFD